MRAALLAALLALPGCSAILSFNQCDVDADCLAYAADGAAAYCTNDHICVSDYPSDRLCAIDAVSSTREGAISIGGLFQLSGGGAAEDTARAHAVQLAVKEINLTDKRPLRLVLCDTGGDPERARKAYAHAVDAFSVVAFVGPSTSAEVTALGRPGESLLAQKGALVVSPSATAAAIGSLTDDDLVWRTAPSDTLQGLALASLVPMGTTRVASAYVSSIYGTGLNAAFTAALATTFAPPLVPASKGFPEGTQGADVATFLAAQTPEVALIAADADAARWVAAIDGVAPALDSTRVLLTDRAKSRALFGASASTALLGRINGISPAAPSGAVATAFQAAYMGQYGTKPTDTAFVASAYDATYAIALAMAPLSPPEAGVPSGRYLIPGMGWLADPGGSPARVGPADYAMVYQRFANGDRISRLEGASGPIVFDPSTGDLSSFPFEVWDIDTSGSTPSFRTVKIVTP